MRFAVGCVLAIGCSSGRGVDVEITPPQGTVRVELLVAPSDCSDPTCDAGIAWTTAGPQAAGKVYDVDHDTRNMLGVPASGSVRFQLHSSTDDHIDRIAAIAFDGQDNALALEVLRDLVVPTNSAEIWQVQLEPIVDIPDMPDAAPAAGSPTKREHVWRAPAGSAEDASTYPSCLVTQEWDDSAKLWNRDFVVPSDRDCDNQTIECNPFWYDFDVGTPASVCATATSGHFTPACVLGGSLCADGRSDSTACTVPTNSPFQCVPDAICKCTDPGTFDACVRQELSTGFATPLASPITYADCEFPFLTGAPAPCQSNSANLQRIAMPPSCTGVALYRFDVPGKMLVATNNASFTLNGASFQMQVQLNDTSGCAVTLVWQSGASVLTPLPLLVDVAYGSTTHLLMPVKLGYQPTATCPPPVQRLACQIYGAATNDQMFTCVK